MVGPSVDNGPVYILVYAQRMNLAIELIQTASSGAARVLGVLRERYSASDAIVFHLRERVFCERIDISECDVGLMRGCIRRELVQQLHHFIALTLCPMEDG